MSDKEIKITERTACHVDNVVVSKPKLEGCMAFHRINDMSPWTVTHSAIEIGYIDPYCPYPLHKDRASAIAQAQKNLPQGGEVMIFKVAE